MKSLKDKKILIIYTGGTIGMVSGPNGYIPVPNTVRDILSQQSIMHHKDMPSWDIFEFEVLLDSSNVGVAEWNQMGRCIFDHYRDYDGFVVLHGTDTMAYSASAMSFMLQGLDKPVVFTGSQIPLCEIRSDGLENIFNSICIAAEGVAREVCICFSGKLLRGNRTVKLSSDRFIAFESPNYAHLAEIGINIQYNEGALERPDPPADGLKLVEFRELPIGVIKVFPGIQFSLFEGIMTERLRAIVLETFGAGNIPASDNALLPIIKKAYEHGVIITVCSQCLQGTVSLGTYETSRGLSEVGAVGGADMTTEAAVAKLYYLFSAQYSKEAIKAMMSQNMCGELTE
ncbi:asparaginase [Peptoniphilus equinus]|uniref:asparaginase n=1 Tax=Peptoniphilus equinus TaxID=3016343 RepID=A0ABY7QWJ8_9FIRM|nr:asparaginase [Peptoniphilus equinus]WBW50474.1 asparaginase [Peptoniphilus equinus]